MNAKRIARRGIVIAALCVGFGVAGRDAVHPAAVTAAMTAPDPLAGETLPIPAPAPADGRLPTSR